MVDDDRFIVIASHGGNDRDPAWWLNLKAHPSAAIDVGNKHFEVSAREAVGEEREELWGKVCDMLSNYRRYQSMTDRQIPVVILELDK